MLSRCEPRHPGRHRRSESGGTAQFQPHRAPPADFRPLTRNATFPRLLAVLSAYVRAASHRPDPGRPGRFL